MVYFGGLICAVVGVLLGISSRVFVLAMATVMAIAMAVIFGLAVRSPLSEVVLATSIDFFVMQIAYCGGVAYRCWLLDFTNLPSLQDQVTGPISQQADSGSIYC
jgi:uncharacterized membrane protein